MIRRVVPLGAAYTVPANPPAMIGERIEYIFVQDATGGRAVTWDATFINPPQPSQGANAVSTFTFISVDGTNWRYADALYAAPWSTLFVARGSWAASAPAGSPYVLAVGGNATLATAALAVDGAIVPLDPADYAIGGKAVQIRLVAELITTAAPAITITFGLYPVTAITTAGIMTVGAATTTNTAIASPAASTFTRQAGTALTMPTAGQYLLGAVTSGAMSATQTAVPHYSVMLQARVV